MLFTPDPLTERLTLLWHNHFATSQLKVEDVGAMKRQNDTFRRHARGPFGDLLRAMLCDPALLAWLDAPSNRKGKPNENLARELIELFTLGIGHYSERDVKEAARALTGRTVNQGRYAFHPGWHDDEVKTILGRTGRWDGETLTDRLLEHPATAHRLAWRLCQVFLGENLGDESTVAELAGRLHSDSLHIGRGVELILRSERFFAARNLHAQVSEPAAFVIGTVRGLERFNPPPSTLLLAEWTGRMGQELFYYYFVNYAGLRSGTVMNSRESHSLAASRRSQSVIWRCTSGSDVRRRSGRGEKGRRGRPERALSCRCRHSCHTRKLYANITVTAWRWKPVHSRPWYWSQPSSPLASS
jgi:uncharacterized protein (DUF1800 family)